MSTAKKAAPVKSASAVKIEKVQALFDKLVSSKGKRVKYDARTHTGSGVIKDVYQGGRGAWVTVGTKDRGDVTVRLTQVKLY